MPFLCDKGTYRGLILNVDRVQSAIRYVKDQIQHTCYDEMPGRQETLGEDIHADVSTVEEVKWSLQEHQS